MWWFSGCDRIWYLQARVATVVEDTVKVRLAQAHLAQADPVVKVAMAVAQPRVYRMLINCVQQVVAMAASRASSREATVVVATAPARVAMVARAAVMAARAATEGSAVCFITAVV